MCIRRAPAGMAAAICLATAAYGQATDNPTLPDKGVREIGLSGHMGSRPAHTYDLQVHYGIFQNRRIEYGGELDLNKIPGARSTSVGLFGNYHFPRGASQLPFAGVALGSISRTGGSTTLWGLHGGIKFFLNSAVAITPQVVYRKPNRAGVPETVALQIGINFYLR